MLPGAGEGVYSTCGGGMYDMEDNTGKASEDEYITEGAATATSTRFTHMIRI